MCSSFLQLVLSLLIISAILIVCLNANKLIYHANNLALIKEINNLLHNIAQFKTKYHYYPGDYPFANTLWYGNSGNGDGYVRDYSESLYAWQHMENANLTHLNFIYETRSYAKILKNMIKSKYVNCGYQILADRKLNNLHYYFTNRINVLRVAQDKLFGNLSRSCLSSYRTLLLDKKIDDGKPVSGMFFADTGYNNISKQKEYCVCKKNNQEYFYCGNNNINCIVEIKIP